MVKLHRLFFSLLLIFLPTQLGLHFWPDWAMVLGRRVDYLSPTVYLTDILVIFLLVSWFFDSIPHKFSIFNLKFAIKRRNVQFLLFKLAATLLFIGLNIFVAANKLEASYKWLKVLEFAGMGWYITKTRPSVSFIAFPLSLSVLYSSIIAIGQFFLQHSIGGLFWFLGERTFSVDTPGIARMSWCLIPGSWCRELLRPYATFPHPNVLGGYLAVVLPLFVYQLRSTKKGFYIVALIVGVIALVLTFSRSAWIVGALGLLAAIRYSLPGKRKVLSTVLVGITAFFLLWLGLVAFKNLSVDSESVVVRRQLNDAALTLWQGSPLFGVGLGNFLIKLPDVLVSRNIYFLQPVHDIYLLILAETGIVGLVLFLWFIWFVLKRSKNYRLSFIIFLLLGLVDHYAITLQQGQLLFAVLCSVSLMQGEKRSEDK